MFYRMNHYYINPYGRVNYNQKPTVLLNRGYFTIGVVVGDGWFVRFARYARQDRTASSERHVNKPHSLSKCWRKQAETFWIVIRLITACDLHPKKSDLLWQKEQMI